MCFVHTAFEPVSHLSTTLVQRTFMCVLLLLVWDSFLFVPGACSSLDIGFGRYALNDSVVAHSPHQQDGEDNWKGKSEKNSRVKIRTG